MTTARRTLVALFVAAMLTFAPSAAQATSRACGASGGGLASRGAPVGEGADFVPGRVLVKFKPGARAPDLGALRAGLAASPVRRIAPLGLEVLSIGASSVEDAVARLRASSLVEYAEPDYVRSASFDPDDPYYADPPDRQWNLRNEPGSGGISMPQAWDVSKGSSSVVVAVLDTGVAYRTGDPQADLSDTRFKQGYDFVNNDPYADDDNGHGTHVCGTIAQSTNNGRGCAGAAFNTTVMPVKVLDRSGYGDDAQLIEGLLFAADRGVEVINMSLGGPEPSTALHDALAYAFVRNVVICAAAGNSNKAAVEYPAGYTECVAVGATARSKAKTSYSNYGAALDVMAPGGDSGNPIYQVTFKVREQPSSGFDPKGMTGTSMATPHVSAVAALVKAVHPSWSAADVRGAVSSSCLDLGASGWDELYGWGLVDAYAAVRAPRPSSPAPAPASVSPDFAAAGARSRVTIGGSGFSSKVKVVLEREGETPIAAADPAVSGGKKINCGLALDGAQPGLWNVVVENAALRSGLIEGAFSVDNADSETWYLAEGSTAHGFETFILIQNPNDEAANATVSLMAADGPLTSRTVTVPPASRFTINVNDVAPGRDLSARVTADRDIICERSTYWNGRGEGTDSIGIRSPSYTWYLAEGTTDYGFETFLLIQNPSNRTALVDVTYMTPEGPVPKATFELDGNSRHTINVADDLPSSDVSFEVTATERVIAERSMYWDSRRGGHDSVGINLPAQRWYLAEGSTGWGYEEYVLLENPGAEEASVVLTYMTPSGPVTKPAMSVAAGTRSTVNVNEALPDRDVSVSVTADRGIVAERSMYWNNGTGKGGHNQIGVTQPRQECFLAEGSTDWGFDEWILIQNPNDAPADVGIDYMTESGLVPKNAFALGADSRVTVHVNADVPGLDTSARVYSNMPVIAERSMYWRNGGAGHCSTGLMK